jgi:1,4-alpha-glucan branching enzyme
VDNPNLRFHFLSDFDREMISVIKKYNILENFYPQRKHINTNDQVLAFERGELLLIFNFNPTKSFPDYGVRCSSGIYKVVLDTDLLTFGGQERVNDKITYRAIPEKNYAPDYMLRIYIPSRTALVLKRGKTKNIYDLK